MKITQRSIRLSWAVSLIALMAAAVGIVATGRPGPPRVRVTPSGVRLEAIPGQGAPETRFTVSNEGGRPLVLGEASSSCGCTVASIEPEVIEPGGSGTIVVRATPPPAGERLVQVRVATNAPDTREVVLELTLVGRLSVPFVASATGAVNWGRISTYPAELPIRVETHEPAGSPPWLASVGSTLDALSVTGGLTEEAATLQPGIVARIYEYQTVLTAKPPCDDQSRFAGELVLRDQRGAKEHVIPSFGVHSAAVYALPSSLYASVDPISDAPLKLRIMLNRDRPGPPLDVSFSGDVPEDWKATLVSEASDRWIFELERIRRPTETIRETVTFVTSHPEVPEIAVPVLLFVPDPTHRPTANDREGSDGRGEWD